MNTFQIPYQGLRKLLKSGGSKPKSGMAILTEICLFLTKFGLFLVKVGWQLTPLPLCFRRPCICASIKVAFDQCPHPFGDYAERKFVCLLSPRSGASRRYFFRVSSLSSTFMNVSSLSNLN